MTVCLLHSVAEGCTVIERGGNKLKVEHVLELSNGIQLYFTNGTTGLYSKDGEYLFGDVDHCWFDIVEILT